MESHIKSFLNVHQNSSLVQDNGKWILQNPWNDEAILLRLEDTHEVHECLNNILLPARFTAIYHRDLHSMEFIFALEDVNFQDRSFEFHLADTNYHCGYRAASDRLLLLASMFEPSQKPSNFGYRNLILLNSYVKAKQDSSSQSPLKALKDLVPVSFFVDGIEHYIEQKLIRLSKHLNFFMVYYDRRAPTILVHPDPSVSKPNPQLQLLEDTVPSVIQTTFKDPVLVDLVLSAREASVRLQFLYLYQVLEHAAFYFIEEETRQGIAKILKTPNLLSKPEEIARNVLDLLTETRQSDEAKINKVVELYASPQVLWREIQSYPEPFVKTTEFDGGFKLNPIISADMTYETFKTQWVPKVPDSLRKIRNALVHGRESRQGANISPGRQNNARLKAWIPILLRIAEQVIIFGPESGTHVA